MTAAIVVLAVLASALCWPVPDADVSVLFEQHGRPARPPHPSSVYTPPGSHR